MFEYSCHSWVVLIKIPVWGFKVHSMSSSIFYFPSWERKLLSKSSSRCKLFLGFIDRGLWVTGFCLVVVQPKQRSIVTVRYDVFPLWMRFVRCYINNILRLLIWRVTGENGRRVILAKLTCDCERQMQCAGQGGESAGVSCNDECAPHTAPQAATVTSQRTIHLLEKNMHSNCETTTCDFCLNFK